MRFHRLKKERWMKMRLKEENSWSMAPHEDPLCSNYSRVTAAFVSQHWTDERLHASVRMEDNSAEGHLVMKPRKHFFPFYQVFVLFSWIRFVLEINSKPGKCQHEHIDCHSWTQFHRVRTENQWIELSEAQVLTFVLRSVIAGAFIDNISQ